MQDNGKTLEEWEFNFRPLDEVQLPIDLPPSDDELLGMTTCGECNKTFPYSQRITGVIKRGSVTHEDHFCSNECRNKWRDSLAYVPIICQEH